MFVFEIYGGIKKIRSILKQITLALIGFLKFMNSNIKLNFLSIKLLYSAAFTYTFAKLSLF